MNRTASRSSCAGFTLVEALTATLITGIIFTALATITAQWLPNWDRGFARLQRGGLLALGLERLTNDIAAAQYVSSGAEKDPPLFDGSQLSVTFVRTILAPNAVTGLEVVRYAETSEDRGPELVRSTAALPIGGGSADTSSLLFANPVVLVRSPYRVSFSYAGSDRIWKDAWSGQPALPRAVRVSLRDNATSMLLDVSTSTVIHAELPARCSRAQTVADCPMLAGVIPSSKPAAGE